MRTRVLLAATVLGAAWGLLASSRTPAAALEEERNFAGSAQIDYHYVPTVPGAASVPGPASTFQGFTLEAAVKVAVDISDHLSANVKACYGCHGFELDMAYFDLRAADELNLRVGRFSPSFGAFNLRHDPANHMTSDKPLPYDMGRMLRKGDWNNGVLPSPFPTNGVEVNGTHWMGEVAQLDYAAYAVMGFKNDTDPNPTDLNFQESHLPYYLTSDPRPTAGSRLALTLKASAAADMTLGASGMFGTYDPANRLTYFIAGGDFAMRVRHTALRVEYLVRRQRMDTSDPDVFKYAVASSEGDFFAKHGGYVEVQQPVTADLDLLVRGDGMYRAGNVGNAVVGSGNETPAYSPLTSSSWIGRETLAFAYAIERNFRVKASLELWEFSYADADGRETELSVHLGAVWSF
jgi:hypothetical protein